ncbi:hypothetical protein CHKEEEPN_4456 [Methylorubrum podarium]|nr:hypothetical protein CHKEEEPN_4456 [Methylorubrum podarium]
MERAAGLAGKGHEVAGLQVDPARAHPEGRRVAARERRVEDGLRQRLRGVAPGDEGRVDAHLLPPRSGRARGGHGGAAVIRALAVGKADRDGARQLALLRPHPAQGRRLALAEDEVARLQGSGGARPPVANAQGPGRDRDVEAEQAGERL